MPATAFSLDNFGFILKFNLTPSHDGILVVLRLKVSKGKPKAVFSANWANHRDNLSIIAFTPGSYAHLRR